MHEVESFANSEFSINNYTMKVYTINELIIIAVASSEKSFQSARFIKNGADDFLRKPFCPEEFYCRVMQNIEKLQYIEKLKDVN